MLSNDYNVRHGHNTAIRNMVKKICAHRLHSIVLFWYWSMLLMFLSFTFLVRCISSVSLATWLNRLQISINTIYITEKQSKTLPRGCCTWWPIFILLCMIQRPDNKTIHLDFWTSDIWWRHLGVAKWWSRSVRDGRQSWSRWLFADWYFQLHAKCSPLCLSCWATVWSW